MRVMKALARTSSWRRLILAATLQATTAGAAFAGCGDRPGTPTDVKVVSQQGQITVTWRDTTRKGDGSCHDIEIKRTSNGDLSKSVTGGVCLPGATTGSYVATGLPFGQEYCVRLKARDHAGTQGCVSQNWSATVCGLSTYPPFPNATPPGPAKVDYTIEVGTDRKGGDIRPGFDVRRVQGRNPCQEACDAESACAAWTTANARGPSRLAVCYLKRNPLPRPTKDACCTTGVKNVIVVK